MNDIRDALQGAYGVWVNTDSHALGEQAEVYVGMRIFEEAKRVKTLRHFVYSNLEYTYKVSTVCYTPVFETGQPPAIERWLRPAVQMRAP